MIIGNGDIASQLGPMDKPDITFFASGVSNSQCTDPAQYDREYYLMMEQDRTKHFVYFSSLSIYYSQTMYADFKRQMEKRITDRFQSSTIIRLGNISWGKNPHTLINYLKAHPEAPVLPVFRHVINCFEFGYWMGSIRPGVNDIMNLPGKLVWVPDLVKEIREGKYEQGTEDAGR